MFLHSRPVSVWYSLGLVIQSWLSMKFLSERGMYHSQKRVRDFEIYPELFHRFLGIPRRVPKLGNFEIWGDFWGIFLKCVDFFSDTPLVSEDWQLNDFVNDIHFLSCLFPTCPVSLTAFSWKAPWQHIQTVLYLVVYQTNYLHCNHWSKQFHGWHDNVCDYLKL